jgi:hypothetical protein
MTHGDNRRPTFKLRGTLVHQHRTWEGDKNPDRVPLVIYLDNVDDHNDASLEWLSRVSSRVLNHMADHASSLFPKVSGDLIRAEGFEIVTEVNGRRAIKLRVDLGKMALMFPDPKYNDRTRTLKVAKENAGCVLLKDAHVEGEASFEYIWLDDAMGYGVTISCGELLVESPPARPPRYLAEFGQDIDDLVIATKVKPFKSGGKYVGTSLYGDYPSFLVGTVVGEGNDGLTVKFPPSVGKDKDPNDPTMSMGVEFASGGPLHKVLRAFDAKVLERACSPGAAEWFPNKKMSPDMAAALFKSPWSQKEPYQPLLNFKMSKVSTGARDATRVWRVPDGTPAHDMGAVMLDEDHGFESIAFEDITKGSAVTFALENSCVYIQSASYGYSVNATHIFVHSGSSKPMEIDGQTVRIGGTATADDLAAFGHRSKRQRADNDNENTFDNEFPDVVDAAVESTDADQWTESPTQIF